VRPGGRDLDDLPAPVRPSSRGFEDLPAPVRPSSRDFEDLPAPVRPSSRDFEDLPAPVGSSARDSNLPTPVGPASRSSDRTNPVASTSTRGIDLPTPVGSASRNLDLPAPKGFFDDIPGPAAPRVGGPDDLPAPKGFFDDLQPPTATRQGMPEPDRAPMISPKGFFDDPPPAAGAGGFFDDVPPARAPAPAAPGPSAPAFDAGGMELDDLDLSPPSDGNGGPISLDLDEASSLDSRPPAGSSRDDLGGLDLDGSAAVMPLELEGGGDFGDIDLPSVSGGGDSPNVVTFNKPSGTAAAATPAFTPPGGDDLLDLDEDARREVRVKAVGTTSKPAADKKKDRDKGVAAGKAKGINRKHAAIAVAVLIVGALGAGAFVVWSRHKGKQAQTAKIATLLEVARRHLVSDKPGHWDAAFEQANQALAVDPNSADALGVATQAVYAGYLDEGTNLAERQEAGRTLIARINTASASGVEIERAEGLRAIFDGAPDRGVASLRKAAARVPGDANTTLYLGWAQLAGHDYAAALTTFGAALQAAPNRLPAMYGVGRAQLALGNIEEAAKAFDAVSTRSKTTYDVVHLGAKLGALQVKEVSRFGERERLYLEVAKDPKADQQDPRVISAAWALAGDQAYLAGRIDAARNYYEKATALDPHNLAALIGEARADLAQNNADGARAKLTAILAKVPTSLEAKIALAEVQLARAQYADATALVTDVLSLFPPIDFTDFDDTNRDAIDATLAGPLALPRARQTDLSRVLMIEGNIALTNDDLATAIARFAAAARLVPVDQDITPTVALAKVLARHPDETRRARATVLLEPIKENAKTDSALAVTLGLANMSSGEFEPAIAWFRTALANKPNDVEALYQLGRALFEHGDRPAGVASVEKAFALGYREEIGSALARMYEELGRDDDARRIYDTVWDRYQEHAKDVAERAANPGNPSPPTPSPSVDALAMAGRFYARVGQIDRTRTMSDAILAIKPKHPAGMFLKGQALLAEGNAVEAVAFFRDATTESNEPQFYDGLGRAYLHLDPPRMDDAIKAFNDAIKDPKYLSPRLGIVCARLMRRDYRADLPRLLEVIDEGRALAPRNGWLSFAAGVALQGTERLKDATVAYRRALDLKVGEESGAGAFVQFLYGQVLKDLDKGSDASRALQNATGTYEASMRSGKPLGDFPGCPQRFVSDWARPRDAGEEPRWITEAYRSLGYVERARGNRGAAIRAWETYLGRDPTDENDLREIKRLLANLRGQR
ncbi:MAG TPA: tetratricopeptide repeat protein, partial [Kofleriaceae bacterium]|nr:tetratricopeptide repeat protein [Kofleriaceae bacterium]